MPQLYLQGTALNLKPGDVLLIQRSVTSQPLAIGGLQPDGTGTAAVLIQRVDIDNVAGRTTVTIATGGVVPPLLPALPLPVATITNATLTLNQATVSSAILANTWYEHDLGSFLALQRWNPADLFGPGGDRARRTAGRGGDLCLPAARQLFRT